MPAARISPDSASQARLQAWCVTLLSIQCQAYALGVVLGAAARYRGRGRATLSPAALVVAEGWEAGRVDGAIGDVPALAVEIVGAGALARRSLLDRYAQAGIVELWLLQAARPAASAFFQRSARGALERISPDANGDYFSALGESVVIPVRWFSERPSLWLMLRHWGMLTD